jgi:hypothetical protein
VMNGRLTAVAPTVAKPKAKRRRSASGADSSFGRTANRPGGRRSGGRAFVP